MRSTRSHRSLKLVLQAFAAAALFTVLSVAPGRAGSLAPFKDELFAYPAVVSTGDDGASMVVDYQEMRDINARDEIPERRVKARYVSTGVRKAQKDLVLRTDRGDVRHVAVGATEGASVIVLYLHGQGGSRKQGVDDFTFGGNFNRITNGMAANGGLYLSPDFPDFGGAGAAQVAALIDHYAQASPGAAVIVACGSMGGNLCWRLASDPKTAARLSGLMLMGSLWDDGFLSSPAFRRKVPVYFGHGSRDTVFAVDSQQAFFRSIRAKSPNYPTRFVRFETGTHGTPIRMTDWRDTLNWILSKAP